MFSFLRLRDEANRVWAKIWGYSKTERQKTQAEDRDGNEREAMRLNWQENEKQVAL
jgi:hypothetical protein